MRRTCARQSRRWFLVRFGGKDNQGAPGALTNVDPTVVEENIKMLHYDFAFVRTVVWFTATNGRGAASVDTKFEIEDGEATAFGIEAVPMRLDNINDSGANRGRSGRVNDKILREFGRVAGRMPQMDIGASVDKGNNGLVNGATIAFE